MVTRRSIFVFAGALLAGSVLTAACSQQRRYELLSFFFDGVPEPGWTPHEGYAPPARQLPADTAAATTRRPPRIVIHAHPPYRENRCGRCHNRETGQLVKTPEDGLCMMCHAGLTRDARYVHGPVAVNACLFCHHHHGTPYRKVLREPPPALCLQCHDRDDLTSGDHHDSIKDRACTECHDPHGAGDRFFLKGGSS